MESVQVFKDRVFLDLKKLHEKGLIADEVMESYRQFLPDPTFNGRLSAQKEVMESIVGHELPWSEFSTLAEQVIMKAALEHPGRFERAHEAWNKFIDGEFDKVHYFDVSYHLLDDLLKA
jgi:hypothetical protein